MYEHDGLILTKHDLLLSDAKVEATHNVVLTLCEECTYVLLSILLLQVFGPFMKFLVPNFEYILIYSCNNDVVHVYSYAKLKQCWYSYILSWLLFASMSIILYVNTIVIFPTNDNIRSNQCELHKVKTILYAIKSDQAFYFVHS